jgi:hypothetical protein
VQFFGRSRDGHDAPHPFRVMANHPRRVAQGRKYYERFLDQYGPEDPWVKRYVFAQYGDDPSGEAVFRATFKPSRHVVDETFVIPGYPLLVGQDFGRNPWSLIGQLDCRWAFTNSSML